MGCRWSRVQISPPRPVLKRSLSVRTAARPIAPWKLSVRRAEAVQRALLQRAGAFAQAPRIMRSGARAGKAAVEVLRECEAKVEGAAYVDGRAEFPQHIRAGEL